MTATLGSTGVEDTLLWWIRPASVSSAISVKVPPISTAIRIRFPSTEFVPAYATNCLVNNSLMAGSCQADSFGSIGCRLGQSGQRLLPACALPPADHAVRQTSCRCDRSCRQRRRPEPEFLITTGAGLAYDCLLYTSDAADDRRGVD